VSAKIVASVSRESPRGFSTELLRQGQLADQVDRRSQGQDRRHQRLLHVGHLWLKTALEKNGLTETDVTITPVPFPAMQEALDAGKVDLGQFPQPFAALAEKSR
jgi:ABC-type nitrate/sulfonate/bicarbonate transport systems, periplasmic components